MHQYEEDYRSLISKLNGAYVANRNAKTANLVAFEKLDAEKQKMIKDMPEEEIQKIGEKVRFQITDICYLSQEEKQLLQEIKNGRKANYRQVAFRLVGNVDSEQIMKQYNRNLRDEPVFRTFYLYKGLQQPVRIVYENRESAFPIHDIRRMDHEEQTVLIKNVLAAEMRREFDIEKDPVFRIQGYLTGTKEMRVIISIYPYIPYPTGINGMIYRILKGMTPQISDIPVVDEKILEKMNQELRTESIAYWKKVMLPLPKSMAIPGEGRESEGTNQMILGKTFLYKELGREMVEGLTLFCEKNQVSVKAVLLYAWGNLMGRYHDEKAPLMAVAQSGERMDCFPVRIARDGDEKASLGAIDHQLKEAVRHSNCTIREMESETGISFAEYFRMIHSFVEFSELDDGETGENQIREIHGIRREDSDINLFISYHLYDNNIGIHYFSKGGMVESILDNLHELFLNELSVILSLNQEKFDKKSFIKVSDTDEEKLYKIKVAQIALYLKESGIFEAVSVEEIMKFAQCCRLKTYLSNDVVVSEKSQISNLYIIGEGKLEESMTAVDGMVKSLRILKKGGVFGVESLFSSAMAGNSYTVVSTQAKIVEIDSEVLTEVLRQKPEGWIALLEKEHDQKSKLQRLWTMD